MHLFTKQQYIYRFRAQMYSHQVGRGGWGLGVSGWYIHIVMFQIDNQQEPYYKKEKINMRDNKYNQYCSMLYMKTV